MKRRLEYIILVGIFLLNISPLFAQKDSTFIKIHHKNVEEAKKLKTQVTRDERKLDGSILGMLRIHEEADTSIEKRTLRDKLVKRDDLLHIDSQERITVLIKYKSVSDSGSLKSLIQSLGGEAEPYKYIPSMRCRIPIRKLRQIITVPAVKRIIPEVPGETNLTK